MEPAVSMSQTQKHMHIHLHGDSTWSHKKAYKKKKSSLATVGGRIRSAAYCKTYQLSGTCGKRPQEHNYCLNYT